MLIESITNGQLSLSWDTFEINEPLRVVEPSEDGESVRQIWTTIPEFMKKYNPLIGENDAFFKITTAKDFG